MSVHSLDEEKKGLESVSPSGSVRKTEHGQTVVQPVGTGNAELEELTELQTTETLHRGLKARQISMIALSVHTSSAYTVC